ncbi:hypothetical protein Hanom_Chr04g00313641 [Helianthus anomalus]
MQFGIVFVRFKAYIGLRTYLIGRLIYVGTLLWMPLDLVSTRLGSAQARRHDIPPSCAPEFDTRSTESREHSRGATSP